MFDLLSIGDIKLDTFIAIPQASVLCNYKKPTCELCITHGVKIPVDEVDHQIAGSAPNVAIGVARLGGKTAVLSTMGKDFVYHQARKFVKKEGVNPKYIYSVPDMHSSFSAVLNYEGESTQLAAHTHIPFKIPKHIPHSTWVHLSELGNSYKELFKVLLRQKERHPYNLSFNPGMIQIKEQLPIFEAILAKTDLLFVNKVEAGILCENESGEIPELIQALSKKVSGNVVITDGKNGAYGNDRHMTYHAPMFPGERVEATGAGDAFTSGFLGATVAGLSLQKSLAWGSVNAASAVQEIGPTRGLLTRDRVEQDLAHNATYRVIPT